MISARIACYRCGTHGRTLSPAPLLALLVGLAALAALWMGQQRPDPSPAHFPQAAVVTPDTPPGPPVTASPRVVLVKPYWPGNAAAGRQALVSFNRIEDLLRLSKIPYRVLGQTLLSLDTLRPYGVAILPFNTLSDGALQSLQAYTNEGGRVLAFYPQASAGLFTLFGVQSSGAKEPEFEGQFRRIVFDGPETERGFPGEMDQDSPRTLALKLLGETRVLGWWEGKGQRTLPAVTRNDAGILVGHLLTSGSLRQKRGFLLAALGDLEPAVWGQVARARRAVATQRLEEQRNRWLSLYRRPDLSERRGRVDALVTEARDILNEVPAAPPSDAAHGRAAWERTDALDHVLDRLESAMTPAPKNELRGFWIHTYGPTDWEKVMATAKAGGMNAAFVRVGRGGNAIYPGGPLPMDAWAEKADGDELQRAIDAAHRHGIEFHAWRVLYHLGSAPEAFRQQMAAEDRLVRDHSGAQSAWANPGDPRNQELERRVATDLLTRYDVDGLHLDYIRYPDTPHHNYDFGPVSRREFEREARLKVARWPADVRTGALRERYEEWQRFNITRVARQIATEARKTRPGVKVSAAVWRNYPSCRESVRQEWPAWARAGWLDFVVPMNYVLAAADQEKVVRAQVRMIGSKTPLLAGIGTWQLQTSGDVLAQVRAARAGGAKGFVLFSYNDEEIVSHLEVLAAGACGE